MNKKGYLTSTQNLSFESSKLLNEIDWFELKQDNNEQDPVKKFKTKTDKLIHSDFVVADLNNLTTETAMELGIIYGIAYSKAVMDEMFSNTDYELQNQIKFLAKKHGLKDRDIYCLNSNKEILNNETCPSIERFNDLTGESPLIKIYLKKGSNYNKVLKFLYKNTVIRHFSKRLFWTPYPHTANISSKIS